MKPFACAVLCALTLFGCASAPSSTEAAGADYGEYPAEFKAIVQAWGRQHQVADGARYRFSRLPKADHRRAFGVTYGYGVCAGVAEPDGQGGYRDEVMYSFFIRNGMVIESSKGSKGFGNHLVMAECGRLWWGPSDAPTPIVH